MDVIYKTVCLYYTRFYVKFELHMIPYSPKVYMIQFCCWEKSKDGLFSAVNTDEKHNLTYGSGHGTAAVLLAGFAINW